MVQCRTAIVGLNSHTRPGLGEQWQGAGMLRASILPAFAYRHYLWDGAMLAARCPSIGSVTHLWECCFPSVSIVCLLSLAPALPEYVPVRMFM
jgi:hypothetical protein